MLQLDLISCVTLLNQSDTYCIQGIIYRYSHRSDSVKSPQFIFNPLPKQRKTATLKLNRDKVVSLVYVVPSLRNKHSAHITSGAIQQSLF